MDLINVFIFLSLIIYFFLSFFLSFTRYLTLKPSSKNVADEFLFFYNLSEKIRNNVLCDRLRDRKIERENNRFMSGLKYVCHAVVFMISLLIRKCREITSYYMRT